MTNFLMIHGEWHDASMWDGVAHHLESARDTLDVGQIIAVDLPGHGSRRSFDISRITLDYYVEAAVTPVRINFLSNVTLVAHSFAASFAPQVAARLGDALQRIVLIGGIIPSEGTLPFNTLSLFAKKTTGTYRPGEKGIKPVNAFLERFLYNDVGRVEASIRVGRLVPDPYQPWITPMPPLKFPDGVPLTYVALTKDKFLALKQQKVYAASLPSSKVVELAAGHLAPVVRPEQTAAILLQGVGKKQEEPAPEQE